MEKTNPEILTLTAEDGQRLAASWFAPAAPNGKCCIIGPALAVPRKFYNNFAHFLTSQGFAVLSLDFRGFGDSANHDLLFDEGFPSFGKDATAAIALAKQRSDEIVYIGHSLGGQALGWSAENTNVARAIKVASGTGYYGICPFPQNALRFIFWTVLLPGATRIAGYYPGRTLGVLGDIPKPIATRWAKMCMTPGYFKPTPAAPPPPTYLQYDAPLLSVSFTDDKIMLKAAVDDLALNYVNAKMTRVHIAPQEFGLERIGHLNAFKAGREKLWASLASWLDGGAWQPGLVHH